MQAWGLLHLVTLSTLLMVGLRFSGLPTSAAIIAFFVLGWTNLVLTGNVLSLFDELNNTGAYFVVSLCLAVATAAGLKLLSIGLRSPRRSFGVDLPANVTRRLMLFFLVTGGLVLTADLVMAISILPANPDSIVYRFPRIYFYFSNGSLAQFVRGDDPRLIFYPLNGVLAYLPLVEYQIGPLAFNLVSLGSWFMVGLTTYLFARDLGGPPVASLGTAWLVTLAPSIMVQALSTNDEIIAGTVMLTGLFFVHRWYVGRQPLDFALGASGVFLSSGIKLHVTFYWPLATFILVMAAVRWRRTLQSIATLMTTRGLVAIAWATIVLAASGSFLIYNYSRSGQMLPWSFGAQVLNKPFNAGVALQNITLYTAQLLLTPFVDSLPAGRPYLQETVNRILAPAFKWVQNGDAFTSAGYQFHGIFVPNAVNLSEQSVFIGFTWAAALIAGLCIATDSNRRTSWSAFQIFSLPVWFITYSSSSRYIEGFATYFTYPTIVCGPALVHAWGIIASPRIDRARQVVMTLVIVSHTLSAYSVLATSQPRNLFAVFRAKTLPLSPGFANNVVVQDEIGRAALVIDHTIAWGQPHWIFMLSHPEISYSLASDYHIAPGDHKWLYIFPFRQRPAYGSPLGFLPIRVPDMSSPGLTWIGDVSFVFGPEWVFGAGNDIDKRRPGHDRFVVLRFEEGPTPVGTALHMTNMAFGLSPTDPLDFRYRLFVAGVTTDVTDWAKTPEAILRGPRLASDNGILEVSVRNETTGSIVTRQVSLNRAETIHLGD